MAVVCMSPGDQLLEYCLEPELFYNDPRTKYLWLCVSTLLQSIDVR